MKTKTGYSIIGKEIKYIKLSLNEGIKYFKSLGYAVCINKMFMEKDGKYVHFNNCKKYWIID